ncbi:MAG TPA: tetratricopeptide repeat protein, partial [Pyrinomonadaceae bacterium]|nr:tetratricopeptide repeat protein [Pyrinomonadaceae bacterium]
MGFDKAKAVRAAEKHLAQNKIASAVQEYLRVVENDPEDITALNTLGDLYIRLDKKPEAVACFQRVAQHYRQQGFAPKAVAVYKKITRFEPASPEVAGALAELYEQQGLLVDARAQYMQVIESHERAGRTEEALEVLRHVSELEPNNISVRLRLADKYLATGQNEQAAECFIEAGERQLGRGEHEAALDAFTKALAWRPHSYDALRGQLAAHTALNRADEAVEVLERVVSERPGDLELRNMLARAQLDAENATGAEAAVGELVARDNASYPLFFDVARLHLQQGSVDDAVSVVTRVVEQALSGRQEDALLEILQEALARDPDQLEALRALSRVYTWLRDDDNLRVALENLAEIAETLGRDEDEREALTQLVRLAPYEWRYHERLQALGGAIFSDVDQSQEFAEEQPSADGGEVPTFESFMLNESAAPTAPAADSAADASSPSSSFGEFEWNSVAPPADA